MPKREKELPPIRETLSDYDPIKDKIIALFRRDVYLPLLVDVTAPKSVLKNAIEDLIEAITSGRLRFWRGEFRGRFTAILSKELRRLGAEWDRKQGTWKIPLSKLPPEFQMAIRSSEVRFEKSLAAMNKTLSSLNPAEIAKHLNVSAMFDKELWKTEKKFQDTIKDITVAPKVTPHARARISAEYNDNLQLYITDFLDKEIKELRKTVEKRALAGERYEGMIQSIKDSYGVSDRKAKFLARQETSLMMTKYKQVRYQEAGVNKYKWKCVVGSALHPVRPMHKALDNTVHTWDNPPVVNDKGERKNPGQDYNCRCTAIPIVVF